MKTLKHYLLNGEVKGKTFVSEDNKKYTVKDIYVGRRSCAYLEIEGEGVKVLGNCLEDKLKKDNR